MDSAMPPVPPGITAQQGAPPIRQFAQGGAAAGQPPAPGGAPSPDQLLQKLVDDAGKTLTKIAEITGQTKPELIPILKQAVQALVMFAGKIKTGQGAPDGGSQGTAGEGAPDAGGGAAMGMPQ